MSSEWITIDLSVQGMRIASHRYLKDFHMSNVNALFVQAQTIIDSGSFGAMVSAAGAAKPATKTKITAIVPSFDAYASEILDSQCAADSASSVARDVLNQGIQQFIDACAVAGLPRDVQYANAIKTEIATCQVFIDAVAQGLYEQKTIGEYAQGAARAFFHNVAYYASIKNDNGQTDKKGNTRPDYRIPNAKGIVRATSTDAAKTAKVTREQLDKTLNKALAQLRALTLDDTAADLLDFLVDTLAGFSESDVN
jgi:hypothetical protein